MIKKPIKSKKKYCYISGKITGLPLEEVKAKFEEAEKEVIKLGYKPINPTKNGVDSDKWGDHMVEDVKSLNKCEAVYFLSDWEDSAGATVEHIFAVNTGKKMIYQPEKSSVSC